MVWRFSMCGKCSGNLQIPGAKQLSCVMWSFGHGTSVSRGSEPTARYSTKIKKVTEAEQWTGMLPPEATGTWEVSEEVARLWAYCALLLGYPRLQLQDMYRYVASCSLLPRLPRGISTQSTPFALMLRYARCLALAPIWSFPVRSTTGSTSTSAKVQYGCGTFTTKVQAQAAIIRQSLENQSNHCNHVISCKSSRSTGKALNGSTKKGQAIILLGPSRAHQATIKSSWSGQCFGWL